MACHLRQRDALRACRFVCECLHSCLVFLILEIKCEKQSETVECACVHARARDRRGRGAERENMNTCTQGSMLEDV